MLACVYATSVIKTKHSTAQLFNREDLREGFKEKLL